MTLVQKRMTFTALLGFIPAALLLPAPFAAWYSIFFPAEHKGYAGSWKQIIKAAPQWATYRGYLPWRAWPVVLHHPHGLLALLALIAGFTALFGYMGRDRNGSKSDWGGPPPAGKGQHGTARWRTQAEMTKGFALWQAPKPGKPEPENPSGIMVGQASNGDAWVLNSDQHTLIVGSPGSRKTRGIIIPTIGIIGAGKEESMVIADPKGELYAHTADWLRAQGYNIVRFDLRDPSRGNRSDPLNGVVRALAAGRMDQAAAEARDIAHLMTYSSSEYKGTDPIWPQSTEALIMSLILAISQGQPPSGGIALAKEPPWKWPTPEQKHMGSVYASLLSGGPGGGRVDAWIMQFPPDHPAYEAYGPVRLAVEKTRASILTGARRRFPCLRIQRSNG